MLGKELKSQLKTGGRGRRGVVFGSSENPSKTLLLLLPNASCKHYPSIFICIVFELPIYLFAAPASLLLQRCGNKMIIYRLRNAYFAGPKR